MKPIPIYMKRFLFFASLLMAFACCQTPKEVRYPQNQLPFDNPYAFGLDLSFVLSAEKRGAVYYDVDGTEKSPWEIFRSHGYNWGRLMICNEPSPLGQDLSYVLEGAKKLKEHDYHFALDLMMADGWANPMTQPTPKTLKDMTHEERVVAWGEYVSNVIKTLADAGVAPEIVQVGNEISNGAFWPDGRVYYGEEKKEQSRWAQFTDYLKAGADAVKAVDENIQVMLHVDFGGDMPMSEVFFQKMDEYKVQYDVIGVSFYPWSHGNLMDLRDNLYYTIKKWQKPMYVIETGYYSVPSQYFERKGVKAPFPETPEGQKEWFQAVNEIVMQAPDNLGRGVFWWEPMFRGRGFFDDRTKVAKPIVEAFHNYAYPMERGDGNPRIWDFEEGERP